MRDSQFNTVSVPLFGARDPATIYKADGIPLRVILRNVGPAIVLLAFDSANLSNAQPGLAGVFQLPPGVSEVIILAPKQGVFAISTGGAGLISASISEAFPEAFPQSSGV